jgi:hypothetical protein
MFFPFSLFVLFLNRSPRDVFEDSGANQQRREQRYYNGPAIQRQAPRFLELNLFFIGTHFVLS